MRFFPENRNVTCSTKNYLDVQSSRRCPHVLKENFCMDLAACQKMAQNPCRWSSKWKRESNVPPRMTAARGRCYKAPEKESWPTYCSRSGPNIQAATFPSLERRMPQVKEVYPKCTDVYNSSVILQKCCPSPKTYASVLKAEPKESDIVSDTTEKPRMVQSSDNKRENPLATKCQKLFAGTFKFCEQNISDNVAEFDHCPRKGSNSKVLNKMDDLRQLLHNATTVQIQKSPEISPIKGNVTKEGCKQTSPRSRSNSIDLSKVAACFVIPQATVCGSPTKESLLQNGYGNTTQQDMLCSNSAIAFIMGIGLSDLEDSDDDSDWDSSDDDDPWISIEVSVQS